MPAIIVKRLEDSSEVWRVDSLPRDVERNLQSIREGLNVARFYVDVVETQEDRQLP